jgi:hypothetical protein
MTFVQKFVKSAKKKSIKYIEKKVVLALDSRILQKEGFVGTPVIYINMYYKV